MDYISPNYNTGRAVPTEKKVEQARRNGDYPPKDIQSVNAPYERSGFSDGSADAENSSFSPSHSSSFYSSLLQSPQPQQKKTQQNFSASLPTIDPFARPKRKRRTGAIIAICITAVLLIGLFTSAVLILINQSSNVAIKPDTSTQQPNEPIINNETDVEQDNTTAPVYVKPDDEEVSMEITSTPDEEDSGILSFADIYDKCIDSVVSISSLSSTSITMGTGIIMTEDGYIITNNHVIDGGFSITVTLHNNQQYEAALVGADSTNDLAVLKIETTGLKAAEFGDSTVLRVGDEVVAIGNPTTSEELRGTMTNGIISAIDRNIAVDGNMMTLIQTNAALNSGNSGGPLINCYGQVIGINIMKFASSSTSLEGLGFAIPISVAKPIIDELIENGYVSGRPSIGIMASDIPAAVAAFYGTPVGVLVESIDERAQAASSGLEVGDIIVAIDGETVSTKAELLEKKNSYQVDDSIVLTVYRDGEYYDFTVVLMDESELS